MLLSAVRFEELTDVVMLIRVDCGIVGVSPTDSQEDAEVCARVSVIPSPPRTTWYVHRAPGGFAKAITHAPVMMISACAMSVGPLIFTRSFSHPAPNIHMAARMYGGIFRT